MSGKPAWFKVARPGAQGVRWGARLAAAGLSTVCVEARCPNRGECWESGHAAWLILGSRCTRRCAFCGVDFGSPEPVDPGEPERLAGVVAELGLGHVVITSVTRDDLPDGGAGQFAACIRAVRRQAPGVGVEVLTPDFQGRGAAEIFAARPQVFNHNLETVARLHPVVRGAANYRRSLELLAAAAAESSFWVKSGLMVGLGEEREEVQEAIRDLYHVGVRLLTIGQYLPPSRLHGPPVRYWSPQELASLGEWALTQGFVGVDSRPLARSSYQSARFAPSLPVIREAVVPREVTPGVVRGQEIRPVPPIPAIGC